MKSCYTSVLNTSQALLKNLQRNDPESKEEEKAKLEVFPSISSMTSW